MYLEFAELQVLGRKPMYMADWISKLDDFLRISDRDLLAGTGAIAHEDALRKAQIEYDKFRRIELQSRSPVEEHFEAAVKKVTRRSKVS